MYSQQRQLEIIQQIEKRGSVPVSELAERFTVSRETIRKDLSHLERQGILKRTHGGAVMEEPFTAHNSEYPVGIRGIQQMKEKKEICRKAASFILEGDVIFVDNSSTPLYLPQFMPRQLNITIITNSIKFLLETTKISDHNWLLLCLGGIFRAANLSVYGTGTIKSGAEYYPNKAFFSCAGISPHSMVTDGSLQEIETKQMMITHAQETFLLADHTKLERTGQMRLCDFTDVDTLITDLNSSVAVPDYLSHIGIRLVMAD
ncbi:MAG: DeoR/GlpR family DNA-binding transcription regulator [Clostridiales bacterium]|jgi:DeoR family fructose operon transcriptional repressor|nr:DeoR/GlpR family DNA-binding transcription regulator [Clostridiales bacterium]